MGEVEEYLRNPGAMPVFFGKVMVVCMLNDLVIGKKETKTILPGQILTEKQKSSILHLSTTLSRFPNSVFVGPGNSKVWNEKTKM